VSDQASTEPEEGQPVTTPEPETEAVVIPSERQRASRSEGVDTVDEAAAPVDEVTEAADVADDSADVVNESADVADESTDGADQSDEPAEVEVATPVVLSGRPVQTVGRRKEAVVRVRLMPGTGNFTLNGKTLEQYFPNKLHQQLIREPLVTVEKTERFDIFARLHGGGTSGQAGALRLAIARALIEVEPDDRPPLKKAGFLTRDPRVIERKKYGLKKARKAPQYSKR